MINIENIYASYNTKNVLNDISLNIEQNQFIFILGQNGAGKSTLLKCINGIHTTDKGDIYINNKHLKQWNTKEIAKEIAFIPQEFHLQFDFSVYELCIMARYPYLDFWGQYTQKDHNITQKYIEKLNLNHIKERPFNKLSGGEKQKVLIARALIQETTTIICDETLSNLDINHQIEILTLLKEIKQKQDKTIILISHNINLAAEFADKIIVMKKGNIIAHGNTNQIFTEDIISKAFDVEVKMITNPYTKKQNIVYCPLPTTPPTFMGGAGGGTIFYTDARVVSWGCLKADTCNSQHSGCSTQPTCNL